MIIAGFSGIGKTTLATLYPQSVVDFVCMPYKYKVDDNEVFTKASKASFDYEFIFGWEVNYVKAIKENMSNNKILLIPSDFRVLSLLENEDIQYILCYPKREAKEIYHKRYIERGNTQYFIDIFIGRWDDFLDNLENDSYGRHIILEPDQSLSDDINANELLTGIKEVKMKPSKKSILK